MKRFFVLFCLSVSILSAKSDVSDNGGDKKDFPSLFSDESAVVTNFIDSVYTSFPLASYGLNKDVFFKAYKGYEYLLSQGKLAKTNILTICDFSKSSSEKRLYVIDLNSGALLFNTYVSHGKNSGSDYATSFSNKLNSNKSSLGFMVTDDTYTGKNGYSMRFNGMEPGINDNVRERAIVMHGSNYVNEERAENGIMMGRSFGCPAVNAAESAKIIDAIKGGSCFFIYGADNWYTRNSRILNQTFEWPALTAKQS